jgi:hypothetical protein
MHETSAVDWSIPFCSPPLHETNAVNGDYMRLVEERCNRRKVQSRGRCSHLGSLRVVSFGQRESSQGAIKGFHFCMGRHSY